ncbi:hypothetical protein NEILACOT_05191 [Neisseria lactamica ATCC 23970]|uniref:Uncharacterized protein n=1 Tax=Neisseria lactamica ATCC 23970 TaxID=546265 RepID=D0WCB0_NEILA|nr:hypothetical protein NEILACOT_05191 [Neisseria lactamica ATCC 23970]
MTAQFYPSAVKPPPTAGIQSQTPARVRNKAAETGTPNRKTYSNPKQNAV